MRLSEKFDRLQKLIPGGQGLESDQLMIQTTHYIMQLRSQLCVINSIEIPELRLIEKQKYLNC
ncbi:hypothetical protein G4B88_030612 [Cannabis sativa]|uniref:Uncharacterized protein n=1 Tax=Cannabis sativa TaxID=3483 RepID=A0A7J6H6P5_CANSA|nr:hypothetical protein G4B88_030612 [Cannabis sativa]